MTDRAAIFSSRPRRGVAALVVLVPLLLWIGTGNSFAAHVGGGAEAHKQPVHVGADTVGEEPAGATAAPGSVPHDAGSSHTLHLLGGCIAVLGATLLLLLGASNSRARGTRPEPHRSAVVVALGRHGRSWWRPPAPSPPTTSPVLRN